MFGKPKKRKITDINDLKSLGLRLFHRHLASFAHPFSFESPAAISNAVIQGKCSIGYLSSIRQGATIAQTDIGRFCSIAPGAYLGGGEHPTDWLSTSSFQYGGGAIFSDCEEFNQLTGKKNFAQPKGPTRIENDVWIGQGVTISRGVTVGNGAIIAAKAAVIKDVAPYAIVGGVPAKLIRYRFDESVIAELLELNWWQYDLSPIAPKIDYSNVQRAVELIRTARDNNKLQLLTPPRYTIVPSGNAHFIK
ncbi:MAG: CatB-related O-acetyltransferase [Deltaproteobacteria bacterium]|nr:CatB-related O-acetyltransferase [Deltaproteobacteria bacterium]